MKIKIWGCRGSIPSPGSSTLRYGGNTTCVELTSAGGKTIVVDAGSGIRILGKMLLKNRDRQELCLMLTHSHWDHLMGFPFFMPAYFTRFKINICGGPNAKSSLKSYLQQQMSPPYFPVDFSVMKASFTFDCVCSNSSQSPHGIEIFDIPISHPNGGYGFKFRENGKNFVFLTDNEFNYPHEGGSSRSEYVEFCRGADLLIHDAQYTDEEYKSTKGWGHSTYVAAIDLATEAAVKQLVLFHHDPDRTDDDLDHQTDHCRSLIAKTGVDVECRAAFEGMEIEV